MTPVSQSHAISLMLADQKRKAVPPRAISGLRPERLRGKSPEFERLGICPISDWQG